MSTSPRKRPRTVPGTASHPRSGIDRLPSRNEVRHRETTIESGKTEKAERILRSPTKSPTKLRLDEAPQDFSNPDTTQPTESPSANLFSNDTKNDSGESAPKPSKERPNLFKDLMDIIPELEEELYKHEYDDLVGTPCDCGLRSRTVSCEDCIGPPLVCEECFIKNHRNSPLHWARVWDSKNAYFRRLDISRLRGDSGYAIPLGHQGLRCPYVAKKDDGRESPGIVFTIVHSNGIHGTRVEFCECGSDRRTQLLRSRLFPGTARQPLTAFTFSALREHRIHDLQAKLSAHDYLTGLRRLGNNVKRSKVPVSTRRDRLQASLIDSTTS